SVARYATHSLYQPPAPSHTCTLSLHDALPISRCRTRPFPGRTDRAPRATPRAGDHRASPASDSPRPGAGGRGQPKGGSEAGEARDRKSTRLNSSHLGISYAVFRLKKKTNLQKH